MNLLSKKDELNKQFLSIEDHSIKYVISAMMYRLSTYDREIRELQNEG